jgi:hypothetical protein
MTFAAIRNGILFLFALVSLARATSIPKADCGLDGMARLAPAPGTVDVPPFPASRPLRLEDRVTLGQIFSRCHSDCAQFNFTSLWAWNPHDHFAISGLGEAILLSMDTPNGRVFLEPLGVGPDDAAQTIQKVLSHPEGLPFTHVGSAVATRLSEREKTRITSQRDLFEYVYATRDLVELQRHKELRYKGKQVEEFFAAYDGNAGRPKAEYFSLNEHPELLPKVERFLDGWLSQRMRGFEDAKSKAEGVASRTTLEHFHDFGLKGGVILVDGEVAAFSLGQSVSPTTFAVYVEKADPAKFKGSYQAINQRFAADIATQGFAFVNRMDDWGVPGLRRAKLSYQPSHLAESFRVENEP